VSDITVQLSELSPTSNAVWLLDTELSTDIQKPELSSSTVRVCKPGDIPDTEVLAIPVVKGLMAIVFATHAALPQVNAPGSSVCPV